MKISIIREQKWLNIYSRSPAASAAYFSSHFKGFDAVFLLGIWKGYSQVDSRAESSLKIHFEIAKTKFFGTVIQVCKTKTCTNVLHRVEN